MSTPFFQWSTIDPRTGATRIYSSKGSNSNKSNTDSSVRYSRLRDIEGEDRDAYCYRDSPGSGAGDNENDNDADIYNYDNNYDYEYHDNPNEDVVDAAPYTDSAAEGVTESYAYADGDPDLRIKTSTFDNGEGSTIYDPESGAYDQMLDYTTGSGSYRHHRERMTEDGVYQERDVQRRDDGSRHVHREYENPATGTRTVKDYER
ncbi:hypothetical protein BDV18DRAFT_158523 [Aspergillus unguis]